MRGPAALLALACEDPAKNKTKAVTGEATQQVAPLTGLSSADFAFDPEAASEGAPWCFGEHGRSRG